MTTTTPSLNPKMENALAGVPPEAVARHLGFRREQDGRTMRALERRGLVKLITVGRVPWTQRGWVLVDQ